MRRSPLFIAPLVLVAAFGGCKQPDEPKVRDEWVRLAAAPGRPAALYFTIQGGPTDWTLVRVGTPAARRAELHETMRMGPGAMAGMTMRPLGQVAVPAGTGVTFAPGGKHVMLFDVDPKLKAGDAVRVEYDFANGRNAVGRAVVVAAGDPPPQ